MAEDLEVGVILEPKNDLQEDVGPVQADVEGDGTGGFTPGQRDRQESVISGGFRTALKATGILAILSGLKPLTAILGAILGTISRALVPVVEEIADLIRPLVQFANEAIATPQRAAAGAQQFLETGGGFVEEGENFNRQVLRFLGVDEENIRGGQESGENLGIVDTFANFLTDPARTADQTGEQSKQQMKDRVEDAKRDKAGGFN